MTQERLIRPLVSLIVAFRARQGRVNVVPWPGSEASEHLMIVAGPAAGWAGPAGRKVAHDGMPGARIAIGERGSVLALSSERAQVAVGKA